MLREKKIDELNDTTTQAINKLAVRGRVKLIGSNSLRSSKYGSDYDIETSINSSSVAKVANMIKNAYLDALKSPDTYITDFKCGYDDRLVYKGDYSTTSLTPYLKHSLIPESKRKAILDAPQSSEERVDLVRYLFILRWKPKDIKAGKIQMIDGKYKTFAACILDKTPMKIDIIQKVGDRFAEISENYYITVDGKRNYSNTTKKELEDQFEEEIIYYASRDSFKALKRLFSALRLDEKKNAPKMEKLIHFFNGEVGQLNKIKNEMMILQQLYDNKIEKPPSFEEMKANLQYLKEKLSTIYDVPIAQSVFEKINDVTPENIRRVIDTLIDSFKTKINTVSKAYLRRFV